MINSFKELKSDIKKGLNPDMADAFKIVGLPFGCVVAGFIGVLILAVALDGLGGGGAGGILVEGPTPVSGEEITGN